MINTDQLDPSFLTIDAEVLRKAKESIGEDDERREQTVKIIRDWLKKQPHLTYPQGVLHYTVFIVLCNCIFI